MDMTEFRKELETTINCHSRENGSDTPDFILAEIQSPRKLDGRAGHAMDRRKDTQI
jgi:hypothetical protein